MRLDKKISFSGYTRTEAKELIRKGRVRVSGETVTDAGFAVPDGAPVSVDGKPADAPEELFLMMNKPAGVLTATEDTRYMTVLDLLPETVRRRKVSPAGRLDKDVTGLVILTTDGQTAHRLISPKCGVEKVYLAETDGTPDEADIRVLAEGVVLKDFACRPAKARVLAENLVEITVTEGKFHEVKRLLHHIGHDVIRLKRVSLGGVKLDETLEEGAWRELTEAETALLKRF